jgi:hypothetical protein
MDSIENLKKSLDNALSDDSSLAGKQGPNTVSTPPINPVAQSNTNQTEQMKSINDALNGAGELVKSIQDNIKSTQREANKQITRTQPMPPTPPINPVTAALNVGAARSPQITTEHKLSSNQRRVK